MNATMVEQMMKQPLLASASAFIGRALALLSRQDYEQFIRLLAMVDARLLSPFSFREKIKYLFRDHPQVVRQLNPFMPEGYGFSDRDLQEPRDYKYLEKYEAGIKFFNDLKSALLDESPEHVEKFELLVKSEIHSTEFYRRAARAANPKALRKFEKFHELVKSHKRKEIDAEEVYERAYKKLRDHFDLIKQFAAILGKDTLTPSYVSLPVQESTYSSSPSSGHVLLNNSLRINNTRGRTRNVRNKADYLYNVDEVIKQCLSGKPCLEGNTAEEKKMNASFWWEERKFELDVLLSRLTHAEHQIGIAVDMIRRGEMNETSKLREHLRGERVKVMMVERMFGKLEDLMSAPDANLAHVLDVMRRMMNSVQRARRQFNAKYKN